MKPFLIDTPPRRQFTVAMGLFAAVLLAAAAFAGYYTKGEPREALVAIEMLRSGNWILPVDAAGDMAYKPPMFHWLIALFSLPAGHVNEFTSRLPSVLALLLLCAATWRYAARGDGRSLSPLRPLLASLVLFTSFEVFRAGVNCRVDMLLCAFMAGAVFMLARGGATLDSRGCLRRQMAAVLLMSGAVLTKGPVGVVIPLGIWWVWCILQRRETTAPVWRLTLRAIVLGIAALVIPALWYLAAWQQGGDKFLRLALEENFGRMTGTMSYDSHVKPFWYNLLMLASGLLPWSALLAASLIWKPWQWMHRTPLHPESARRLTVFPIKNISRQELLDWTAVIFVLFFYTLPKSKRGVYLLPLYPFAASLIADYVLLYSARFRQAGAVALRAGWIAFSLYAVAYVGVWPFIVNSRNDRHVAREVERIAGDTPIYTYINSRMDRFYGVDFYLGVRMKALLPSGQDCTNLPEEGYTPAMIKLPQERNFFIAVTAADYDRQGKALGEYFNTRGYSLEKVWESPEKTRDMRQPLILLKAGKI